MVTYYYTKSSPFHLMVYKTLRNIRSLNNHIRLLMLLIALFALGKKSMNCCLAGSGTIASLLFIYSLLLELVT